MLMSLYHQISDIWPFNHKVVFDGENRLILINPGETSISLNVDIYSDWKEWISLRDNTKYPQAIRVIGGDSVDISKGLIAGDIYFLMNGWRIVVPQLVKITGVLYHDDNIDPYLILAGGGVISTVSNLVQTVEKIVQVPWYSGPTTQEIAAQVRTELTPELTKINNQTDGLTPAQETVIMEIYALYGLDPTKPLVVTDTSRTAGPITQQINSNTNQTTVTRV